VPEILLFLGAVRKMITHKLVYKTKKKRKRTIILNKEGEHKNLK